jgi:hypothetical protein
VDTVAASEAQEKEEPYRQTRGNLLLDVDLFKHFLPEPAPSIYLTTRPDLGDAAKGLLITIISLATTRPGAIFARLIAENCFGLSTRGCSCSNLDEESAKFLFLQAGERPDASAAKKIYSHEI